jgi:hypothetical protein
MRLWIGTVISAVNRNVLFPSVYVLSLFFATATTIVLITKLLASQVSNASQNADNYNSHEKLFHLYLP